MTLTREVFDTLILLSIIIGGALAAVRLYRDFTRPLPPVSAEAPPNTAPKPSASPKKPKKTNKTR